MSQDEYAACIEACDECAEACDFCSTACLAEDDPKPMVRCIALAIDCAALCRLASAFMARGSEMADLLCEACAELCEECAEECGKHDMDHCQACAEACTACAEECRRMAEAQ